MISDLNNPIDSGMTSGNDLPSELRQHLKTAGTWGRFVAIVGFVLFGLSIISLVFMGGGMGSMFGSTFGMIGGGFLVIYLVIVLLSLYLNFLLFQFSNNALVAANSNDVSSITDAMRSMANFWKIIGILLAIYLGFILIVFVGGIIGGL